MRRAPAGRSITSPASFSTLRCCETAGRLTGSSRASSPTALGRSASLSKIVRLVPSASALSGVWLATTYGKSILTAYALSRRGLRIASAAEAAESSFPIRARDLHEIRERPPFPSLTLGRMEALRVARRGGAAAGPARRARLFLDTV